jgi:hypothetical protein
MKSVVRVALAVSVQAILIQPACAQWQGAAGASLRGVTHAEYDLAGRRLVREAGWLPGAVVKATYRQGDFTWFSEGEVYRGDIGYQGQTQAGAQAASKTATGLSQLRFGGTYALNAGYSVLATLEWQQWKREIIGVQQAAGLQEKYRSGRLVAGVRKTLLSASAGAMSVDGAVVLSAAERLQVGFSGLLDPTSLELKRSQGIRLGAAIRPSFAPYLELRTGYEWIRTPRSGDAAVTRAGQFVGTIAQPELKKQALTFTVSTIFG